VIEDEATRFYVLAFLGTPTGHALIRRDKTGSVIDHVSVSHLASAVVPMLDDAIRLRASDQMWQ